MIKEEFMPPTSRQQQKMIFAKRSIYKTKEKTPDKWKFIWDKGWEKPVQETEESNFGHYITQAFQEHNESRKDHENI